MRDGIEILLAVIIAVGAFMYWVDKAYPHDAPSSRKAPYGWAYDTACCNTIDCRQLSRDEVEERPDGSYIWRSKHSGAVHVFLPNEGMSGSPGNPRIRRSQDEFFHGCETNVPPVRKLCLYVPDRGI